MRQLAGFDNLDFTPDLDLSLTNVAQPSYEVGQTAVEILLEHIQQKSFYRQVVLHTKLTVHSACGTHLKNAPNLNKSQEK